MTTPKITNNFHPTITFKLIDVGKTTGFIVTPETRGFLGEFLEDYGLTPEEIEVACGDGDLIPEFILGCLRKILAAGSWGVRLIEAPPNYLIPISPRLFTGPQHRQQMGEALWVYLWLVDRITPDEYVDKDGVWWGRVRHGQPINYQEIAAHYDISLRTVNREMNTLRRWGYIRTRRDSQGVVVEVRNSYKWNFKKAREEDPLLATTNEKTPIRSATSDTSEILDSDPSDKCGISEVPHMSPQSPAGSDEPKAGGPLTYNNIHKENGDDKSSPEDPLLDLLGKDTEIEKIADTEDSVAKPLATLASPKKPRKKKPKYTPEDQAKLAEVKTHIEQVHRKHWGRGYPWASAAFGKENRQLYGLLLDPGALSVADVKEMVDQLAEIVSQSHKLHPRDRSRIDSFSVGALVGFRHRLLQEIRKKQQDREDLRV